MERNLPSASQKATVDLKMGNELATNGHSSSADWTLSSWTAKEIKQDVIYDDRAAVDAALMKLERYPPLVSPDEIVRLKENLREVALGKAFVLQGGHCAELFDYCTQPMIESMIKLLLQMSLVLIWGANKPVHRIGRIAGQYAKPRSSPNETINGVTMPAFRGDNINGFEATINARKPDPGRLVEAYHHSAATLNHIRAALNTSLADLHTPLDWSLGNVLDEDIKKRYRRTVSDLIRSLRFMKTIRADTSRVLETVDLYASHEGLVLEYEQCLTRLLSPSPNMSPSSPPEKSYYDTSAHFLWIGDRTRDPTHAHVEFFRGIANPIGIKVGPTMDTSSLSTLLNIVNPTKEIGKVTLISRYGFDKIEKHLPDHIAAVRESGHTVVWQCDPMHGNTHTVETGSGKLKTRKFSHILSELRSALLIHRRCGSFLGGVHLELTGEPVTECLGGSEGLEEEDLNTNYRSFCDPRLNEKQALELALEFADFYHGAELEDRYME
jgi:3-deoxy-7-phosphoheptulonate synthase